MTLRTKVVARYSAQRLLNLTNPDNPGATTLDSDRLDAACDDATADFATHAMLAFDETVPQHVSVAVRRVVALLLDRQMNGANDEMEASQKALENLAGVTSRKRIVAQCDRSLGPSPDVDAAGNPRRPEFDAPRFERFDMLPPADSGEP